MQQRRAPTRLATPTTAPGHGWPRPWQRPCGLADLPCSRNTDTRHWLSITVVPPGLDLLMHRSPTRRFCLCALSSLARLFSYSGLVSSTVLLRVPSSFPLRHVTGTTTCLVGKVMVELHALAKSTSPMSACMSLNYLSTACPFTIDLATDLSWPYHYVAGSMLWIRKLPDSMHPSPGRLRLRFASVFFTPPFHRRVSVDN